MHIGAHTDTHMRARTSSLSSAIRITVCESPTGLRFISYESSEDIEKERP